MKKFRIFTALVCMNILLIPLVAQENQVEETITLPDLTTNIEGGALTVVPQALPDFSALIPSDAPVLPELPSLAIPAGAAESLSAEAQEKKNEKRVFLEGMLGAGYSGFFTGDFKIFKPLGKFPFELSFSHETANGYARQKAGAGFYDSATILRAKQSYSLTDTFSLGLNGFYESAADGLQGQSDFFYNTTLQHAKADASVLWKLPRGFYLGGGAEFSYINRFFGYLAGDTGLIAATNSITGNTGISVTPRLSAAWNRDGVNVYANALYCAYWAAARSTELVQRGEFTLAVDLAFAALPDFKTGANLSAIVTNSGNFVVPFSVFAKAKIAPVSLYAQGGMRSALTDIASLFAELPFTSLAVPPVEQSDWFANLQINVPVNIFSFDAKADFSTTAFANKTLLPDYDAFNDQTGLFPITAQHRTKLDTDFSASLHKSMFGIILGFKSQWLDKNPLYYNHALTAQVSVFSPVGTFAVTLDGEFGFDGDMLPILGLSGYYAVSESIRLSAELTDMIKLFTGRGRTLAAPYITRSGIAALKVKVLF